MANNRMWLVHKPSGERVLIGKRMAIGWYHTASNEKLGAMIKVFLERCELFRFEEQDSFTLELEDESLRQGLIDPHLREI